MSSPNLEQCHVCHATPDLYQDRTFIRDGESSLTLCNVCSDYYSLAHQKVKKFNKSKDTKKNDLPSPKEIYDHLSLAVIGQEHAKKSLSIAVAHHYRRLENPKIGKSNVLIIGPSGTGKTEIARSISEFLDVPFIAADATSFTTKGYIGEDVDSVLQRLLINAQWNIDEAQKGIIFIDEIDKIARRGNSDNQVGTVAVQQELLRLMEGDDIKINKPNPNAPSGFDSVFINTSNILFICAGAFVGLEDLVHQGGDSKSIGIGASLSKPQTDWASKLDSKHLIQYGLIPEILGRLPVLTATQKLTKEELLKILIEPKNSLIKQYEQLFQSDKIKINFSQDFLDNIISETILQETGARGLRKILENKMKETFFNIDLYKNQDINILKDSVEVVPKPAKKHSVGKLQLSKANK